MPGETKPSQLAVLARLWCLSFAVNVFLRKITMVIFSKRALLERDQANQRIFWCYHE
jgi:hypothetical protein